MMKIRLACVVVRLAEWNRGVTIVSSQVILRPGKRLVQMAKVAGVGDSVFCAAAGIGRTERVAADGIE